MLRRDGRGAASVDPGSGDPAGTLEVVGRSGSELGARDAPIELHAQPAVAAPDPEPAPRGSWLARYWVLLVLLGAAVGVSVFVRHVVYPAMSWNRDEATYLWQVRALRAGQLLTTTGGIPQFVQPWLTGVRHGQFFSQYTLGWPGLMFVADLLFGSPAAAIVWGTVLAVLGTYVFTREITRDHTLALVSAALMLASPMIVTQSGVYLGYLFSLGLGLLFGAALLSGLRRNRSWLLVAAGALLGILVITRPFDAVLWALAMGGYGILTTWREWPRQFRAAALVLLGLVPFLALTLIHNHIVTGSFTQFPFTAKEPLDKFGFGYRRLMPRILGIDYTFGQAVRGSGLNAFYVPQFLAGSYLGLLVAGAGLWLRRRDRSTLLLLALVVVFPVGYFMFWGNRLASGFAYLSGPVYFIPLFVPLCIWIATALLALWRRRRGLLVILCVLLVVATVPFMYDKSAMNKGISEAQVPWEDSTASLPGKSLVIVRDSGPYLLHINPFSENSPDLDGRVLYAVDRGAGSFALLDRYPDRTAYIQRTSDPALDDALHHSDAVPPKISLLPIKVVEGGAVTLRVQVRNPTNAAAVVVVLQVDNRVDQRTLAPSVSGNGIYETEWTLAPESEVTPGDGQFPVSGQGSVVVRSGSGATTAQALTGRLAQEKFAYQVDGATMKLLEPSLRTVIQPVNGIIVQRDVGHLSTLAVDAVAS
jgi:hypothetical protein